MSAISENQIAGVIAWRLSPLLDVDRYRELLKLLKQPGLLFDNRNEIADLPELARKLQSSAFRKEVSAQISAWKQKGIGVVVYGDDLYPDDLREIADPPLLLTYRGQWKRERFANPRLSIVGARRADTDGVEIAHCFAKTVAEGGATVVSGLALGVDGAAHRGALAGYAEISAAPPTIAILGNGLTQIYPRSHTPLAKDILDRGGILISQFDPDEPAYPVNFLNRNRLIAALSIGTLVVQASEKSGSLVTARNALEYGKELFIVPGSIKDPRYSGSNKMLQHGAHLVINPDDLFELIPDLNKPTGSPRSGAAVAPQYRWLIECLEGVEAESIENLMRISPQPERLFEQVLALELEERIVRKPGNFVALTTTSRLKKPSNTA